MKTRLATGLFSCKSNSFSFARFCTRRETRQLRHGLSSMVSWKRKSERPETNEQTRHCNIRLLFNAFNGGSIIVWRFGGSIKPILSAGLRFHSHLSGGLQLRNYRAVAGNHKFSSQFSVFACFCGGYSNRVKRLRRLSCNFILLKASLFQRNIYLYMFRNEFLVKKHDFDERWSFNFFRGKVVTRMC